MQQPKNSYLLKVLDETLEKAIDKIKEFGNVIFHKFNNFFANFLQSFQQEFKNCMETCQNCTEEQLQTLLDDLKTQMKQKFTKLHLFEVQVSDFYVSPTLSYVIPDIIIPRQTIYSRPKLKKPIQSECLMNLPDEDPLIALSKKLNIKLDEKVSRKLPKQNPEGKPLGKLVCPECEKVYLSDSWLLFRIHLSKHHDLLLNYICPHCKASFGQQYKKLAQHLISDHSITQNGQTFYYSEITKQQYVIGRHLRNYIRDNPAYRKIE